MLSATETIDRRKLKDYFCRANYAVLKDSNILELSSDISDQFDDLRFEYAVKFPIASTHHYACWIDDDDCQIVKAEVAPTSLLYSMPDEWQERFCLVLDALNAIEWDENSYHIALLDPEKQRIFDDPFGDRHKRWESDAIEDPTFYPYGKD